MALHYKKGSRQYLAETVTDTDNITLHANTPTQVESLLHSLEQAARGGIDLHVNANETDYMCFNQLGAISQLHSEQMKLVDKFLYLCISVTY